MAKSKAELEQDYMIYIALREQWLDAEQHSDWKRALESAIQALQYVDSMVRYARRYEKADLQSIEAIDLIVRLAPLLFEHEKLDALEALIEGNRSLERFTSESLADKLKKARHRMRIARRLWNQLESQAEHQQVRPSPSPATIEAQEREILEEWCRMGLVRRLPEGSAHPFMLVTSLAQIIRGKCPQCGAVVRASKGVLLEPRQCPRCARQVAFVLMDNREERLEAR